MCDRQASLKKRPSGEMRGPDCGDFAPESAPRALSARRPHGSRSARDPREVTSPETVTSLSVPRLLGPEQSTLSESE